MLKDVLAYLKAETGSLPKWLTSQSWGGLKSGAPGSPMRMQRPKHLVNPLLLSEVYQQGAELEAKCPGLQRAPIWDASVAQGGLNLLCATTPAPHCVSTSALD